jgi:S-adenosylmethionine hydrolase
VASTQSRSSPWQPCGVITLTTDYGLQDPFVGVVKGRILREFAQARIVDLTHAMPAFQPRGAGFWVARSSEHFPAGSVHVAVVDPGVGGPRRIVALQGSLRGDAHCWLAPDNGLLLPVVERLGREGEVTGLYHCELAALARLGVREPSATFHGRDVFAPLAAALAAGRCRPAELGSPLEIDALQGERRPPGQRAGSVVAVDRFGNLISDVEAPVAGPGETLQVSAGGRFFALGRTYGDAAPGEYLALVNSFGVLEIARREGNAAQGLGLGYGAEIKVVSKS